MKQIDDKELDLLINKAITRERQVQQMNARIVQAIRRHERRQVARMWLRVVAFALFVPISLLAFAGCAHLVITLLGGPLGVVAAIVVAITGIITEVQLVADFSTDKV